MGSSSRRSQRTAVTLTARGPLAMLIIVKKPQKSSKALVPGASAFPIANAHNLPSTTTVSSAYCNASLLPEVPPFSPKPIPKEHG